MAYNLVVGGRCQMVEYLQAALYEFAAVDEVYDSPRQGGKAT